VTSAGALSVDDRGLLSDISREAGQLLTEASKDRNGTVLMTETFSGLSVETNGKDFVQRGDPRSEAKGRQIVRKLVELGLLEQRDSEGQVFTITDEGFRVADLLKRPTA
jgi:hypothetical protein